jgi:hypothetical protein
VDKHGYADLVIGRSNDGFGEVDLDDPLLKVPDRRGARLGRRTRPLPYDDHHPGVPQPGPTPHRDRLVQLRHGHLGTVRTGSGLGAGCAR